MPAATNKSDLIAACEKEYAKLTALLDALDPGLATAPDAEGWSIKDVLAHRAHWVALYLDWYADGAAGRPVHMPAEGYGWNQLKPYNAALRDRQSGVSWDEARTLLASRHKELMDHLASLDDAALYGGPMTGGNGKWTTGRYAEAAGASHYRSAAKFVRQRKREATA